MKIISVILGLLAGIIIASNAIAEVNVGTGITYTPISDREEQPAPVILRDVVTVTEEVIYLSDLFVNLDSRLSDKIVAYSPEPGRQASYGAQWLYKVAQYYQLDWKPKSYREVSIVSRESFIIEREQIEETIMMHLIDQGIDPEMDAEISNRNIRLFLPVTEVPDIAINNLRYDDRTNRFTATITAPANSPLAQHHRVTGRVFLVINIPVLTHHINAGEVISADDIEWRRVRSEKITRETATDLSDLIGMAPKRGLRPGLPIRLSEVAAPLVVTKKSQVTIIYQHANMTLTVQGLALQSGAIGDVIRISNVQSKSIVDAKIIASGQAIVKSIELLAMN